MPEQVDVWYEGWGERWRWGSLMSSTAINGRPWIAFEYSDEALSRGLELSAYTLPLRGPKLRKDFPAHQLQLPGPVYDSLPDGWGMLLMDRLFRQRGLQAARIGPLERLSFVGSHAMGAMSYVPVAPEMSGPSESVCLPELAAQVQTVLQGEGAAFLQQLLQMGGSPQGARPKALLYRDAASGLFSTAAAPGLEPWLVKFPAHREHPEVCAVETVYAHCLRACGIATPDTEFFALPNGQAAFASRRFDRQDGMRVPMQSLAAFTGADYRAPGALDYTNFLRATQMCTNDVRQKAVAFERAVFNVTFNNRDDHTKNFCFLMSPAGGWSLAPAYDVTFCEGPGGYHQMDVMGEALNIERKHLLALGEREAELSAQAAGAVIDRIGEVACRFSALAEELLPGRITGESLRSIQRRIDDKLGLLR
ncbi:type II toxin-antitoxin system HipA family toxin [Xylophilus rhododendri]|uniref:Type II toxin-antitoxin system HipA family toxin n=1 Tax=Xylophilus rhododendri TaxID=2697032 RepID=A0A857J121_9BURK|nr:type II toxin-antitoxin system HipA family toxin [Xylophilus rhododendri]QHI96781.1 type II toxin-antitoxin system HipA family toxin [Xylophilus rhododendri]